jgi:hypothetical protein
MALNRCIAVSALGQLLHLRSRQHPGADHLTEMTGSEQLRNSWRRHPQQLSCLTFADQLWQQQTNPAQRFKGIEGFS